MRLLRNQPGDPGTAPHQRDLRGSWTCGQDRRQDQQLQTYRSSINPEQRKAEQEPKSSSCVYPAGR